MSNSKRNTKPLGAILPDGRINTALLQREIANELAADARFSAEDVMKKRAVHISKDYDEFKNFVAASELKPVSSSEMGQLFVQGRQGQGSTAMYTGNGMTRRSVVPNIIASNTRTERDSAFLYNLALPLEFENISIEKKNKNQKKACKAKCPAVPKKATDLEREWKRCCKTPISTLNYLLLPSDSTSSSVTEEVSEMQSIIPSDLRLRPERVAELCKIEINANLMEDILEALGHYASRLTLIFKDNDATIRNKSVLETPSAAPWNFIYKWMLSLTKSGRFDLNLDFLEARYRGYTLSILDRLENICHNNTVLGGLCELVYNQDDIRTLKKVYRCRNRK